MRRLLGFIFGCHHTGPRSWPISLRRGKRVAPYQTCLDCGAELAYTFEEPIREHRE